MGNPELDFALGQCWKRGLFKNVHILEVLENIEIQEILESPENVENKGNPTTF